jgi:hypothetical protein
MQNSVLWLPSFVDDVVFLKSHHGFFMPETIGVFNQKVRLSHRLRSKKQRKVQFIYKDHRHHACHTLG